MEVEVYDRAANKIFFEKQYKAQQADFLYNTFAGRILLRLFIASKTFSKLNAISGSGKKSVKKIKPFIEQYNIDMTDFGDTAYESFNDFFIRKTLPGKRPFSVLKDDLIAVADSKLTVFDINDALEIEIKESVYTVDELLKDKGASQAFAGGTCLLFRLTVDDCHRYCFFDNGRQTGSKIINGCLHTVGPVSAKRYKVYKENFRVASFLETRNFGDCVYMEVGALLVGKIHNHDITDYKKGDEKGFFSPGASTIVLLFKKDTVRIDDDIRAYSKKGIETKIKMGEKIGVRYD